MNTNATICQQPLKVHDFYFSNFAGTAEGNSLLQQQGNSNLSESITLVQGFAVTEAISQIQGYLHRVNLTHAHLILES